MRLRARLKRGFYKSGRVGLITPEQWLALCVEYHDRCAYCFAKTPLTMDHFVSLAQGGANDISNIVPACLQCNSGKQAHTFLLWFARRNKRIGRLSRSVVVS